MVKVKVMSICITFLRRSGIHALSRDITVLPALPAFHPHAEWAIRAFAFPYAANTHLWPRRDGRLSRPWCEVAPAEILTCNLPITSPALYHTATSVPMPFLSPNEQHRSTKDWMLYHMKTLRKRSWENTVIKLVLQLKRFVAGCC